MWILKRDKCTQYNPHSNPIGYFQDLNMEPPDHITTTLLLFQSWPSTWRHFLSSGKTDTILKFQHRHSTVLYCWYVRRASAKILPVFKIIMPFHPWLISTHYWLTYMAFVLFLRLMSLPVMITRKETILCSLLRPQLHYLQHIPLHNCIQEQRMKLSLFIGTNDSPYSAPPLFLRWRRIGLR